MHISIIHNILVLGTALCTSFHQLGIHEVNRQKLSKPWTGLSVLHHPQRFSNVGLSTLAKYTGYCDSVDQDNMCEQVTVRLI